MGAFYPAVSFRMRNYAHSYYVIVAYIAATIGGGSPALAQQGAPPNGEWPTYGGDLGGSKYSPLDQIDRSNFEDLEIRMSRSLR